MKMEHVSSSNIDSVGYDKATKTLYVKFLRGGATYTYAQVPEIKYKGILAAASAGEYLKNYIKDVYSYKKL